MYIFLKRVLQNAIKDNIMNLQILNASKVGAITMGKSIIDFINKILDTKKLIFRLWIVLWLCLLILLVLKFCFKIWFPIIIENENFIIINNYITNSWLKYLVSGILYFISANILYLTSCIKFKYSKWYEGVIINILIAISFCLKNLLPFVAFIPEALLSVVIPIIYLLRKYKKPKLFLILFPIIIQALTMAWDLNIFLIRDVDFNKISEEYFIITLVIQLDYYIFIIITWIGVNEMIFSLWFMCKDSTKIKSYKQMELSKKNPNMKVIAKMDAKIAELEKEGK